MHHLQQVHYELSRQRSIVQSKGSESPSQQTAHVTRISTFVATPVKSQLIDSEPYAAMPVIFTLSQAINVSPSPVVINLYIWSLHDYGTSVSLASAILLWKNELDLLLFLSVTRRRLVVGYWRFVTAYRSHLQELLTVGKWDWYAVPKRW
jgi:hypothetical protein